MPEPFYELPVPHPTDVRILDLGPAIDPPFVDARRWDAPHTLTDVREVRSDPFEPTLTDELADRIRDVALRSEQVRRELDGVRYAVIGASLIEDKESAPVPLLIIYRYTDDEVLHAVLDEGAESVLRVDRDRYQPALTADEVTRARELVGRSDLFAGAAVDVDTGAGLLVEEENPTSDRFGHRLADLRFGPADHRLPTAWAVVDLSSDEVADVGLIMAGRHR